MNLKNLKMKKFTGLLLAFFALSMFSSCSEDDSTSDQNAKVKISMTDAPGDYDKVFIDVLDVKIKTGAEADDDGWVSVGNVQPEIYDLLTLTGGITQLLANAEIPAGTLGQIRLILGPDNSVVLKDGTEIALSAPSAQQSGLKLLVNEELEAGMQYEYLLDFDVDKSIVSAGNSGVLILKPVIRLSANEGGAIMGKISPGSAFKSLIEAKNAAHIISAYTDANGEFVLHGVPDGIYELTITPAVGAGYSMKTVSDVQVADGAAINLETNFLAVIE
jgi:hypothetical protein